MGKTEGQFRDKSIGTMAIENPELMQKVFRFKVGFSDTKVMVDGVCQKGYYRIIHDYKTGQILGERELSEGESRPYWPARKKRQ